MTTSAWRFTPAGAVRFWARNARVGRRTIVSTLLPRFLEAIAYLAVMGLGLGVYVTTMDGVDYVTFIAPGVAAFTVMLGAVIETTYNTFVRIHVRRVYEAAVTTPLSVGDVVVGEYLWATTRASAYGLVFLLVMTCFGLVSSPVGALLSVPVLVLGALMFAVLGMLFTAFVSNIEHYNLLYTAILTPMFLFSGIFFPFDRLPDWAQVIGWCLPLSHLVAALRDLTLGRADLLTAGHVAVILAITAVLFVVPLRLLAVRLRR